MSASDLPAIGPASQLAFGAVTTMLLDSARPVSTQRARRLLDLIPGLGVESAEDPLPRVVSPDLQHGVDCPVPTADGVARGVGHLTLRAVLTGGQVLQGSAYAEVAPGAVNRRRRWAHYVARPGTIEILTKAQADQLLAGWQKPRRQNAHLLLDLASASHHPVYEVLREAKFDRYADLRCQRLCLHWAADLRDAGQPTEIDVWRTAEGDLRARLLMSPDRLPGAVKFCEILALHDWLLRTMKVAYDRGDHRPDRLAEAVTLLGHLWNPEAHQDPEFRLLWRGLDIEDPQFSWQWLTLLERCRTRLISAAQPATERSLTLDF